MIVNTVSAESELLDWGLMEASVWPLEHIQKLFGAEPLPLIVTAADSPSVIVIESQLPAHTLSRYKKIPKTENKRYKKMTKKYPRILMNWIP